MYLRFQLWLIRFWLWLITAKQFNINKSPLRCVHTVVLLYDVVLVQKYVYDLLLDRTRTFVWCQTNFCPNGRTQQIISFVYEDQCATDLFDEKTKISSSEWRDLVLLYVVHVYDVQKIQHGWRTSYSYTHTYFCTCTRLRRSFTYKSTRQNSLVYDRVDAPLQSSKSPTIANYSKKISI